MCSHHEPAVTTDEAPALEGDRVYQVSGMTCEHCAASVTEEVEQVPGVTAVNVDVASGRLAVGGDGFSDEAIRAAVDEAGYEVVTG